MTHKSPTRRRTRGAPFWVEEALSNSPGPKRVIEILLKDATLAPLWETLGTAQRERVVPLLPEYIGFAGSEGQQLPWSERLTGPAQRAHAKHIASLAKQLNEALSAFAPLDPFLLHQVFPQDDDRLHFFLAGLPPIAARRDDGDSLLLRLARMAERFNGTGPKRVKRPTREDAWETCFVRTLAPLFDDVPGRAFLAALVGALSGRLWDAERVRKCLARSPEIKGR